MLPPSSGTKPGSPAWREPAARRKRQAPAWNLLAKPSSEPQPALPGVIGEPRPNVGRVSPGQNAVKRFHALSPLVGVVLLGLTLGAVEWWRAPAASASLAPPVQTHLPSPDGDMARGSGASVGGGLFFAQAMAGRVARSFSALELPIPGRLEPPIGLLSGGPSIPPLQSDQETPPISDGQFVWGPNVGRFDMAPFLAARRSPLVAYAPELELWASYSSVNPKLLLAALELRYGLITALPAGWTEDDVLAAIEDTSLTMATAFYEHLQTWGDRRPVGRRVLTVRPMLRLQDGTAVQLSADDPSGSFALAALVAKFADASGFEDAMAVGGAGSFTQVFGALFPSVDLESTANEIDPPGTPPANMLQLPFAMGATWSFGGPHSWNGNSTPPFSSMDFFTGGATCSSPPYLYAVSAASGTTERPGSYTCWLEIDHGGGWETSYYHLQNLAPPASVNRNAALGTIACEICAGGYATGPHVHFSLKYNGAYTSLEGVELTGWTIHVGSVAYNSGSIERDGVSLNPWSQVLNDYHTYFGSGVDTSLQFLGGAASPAGRVQIPVDDPGNANRGAPVDVGASDDFTFDLWIRADPGQNDSAPISCGANDNWTQGNILLDRRRTGGAGFGISVAGGRVAFGVTGPALDHLSLCGTSDVSDGGWHLITVERNRFDGLSPDGFLWLFVDGHLEASGTGPGGDVAYPDTVAAASPADPYLVLGADKYDVGLPFNGWMDEVRVSNILRTRLDFPLPTAPFGNDGNTAAIFHLNEGSGDVIYDTSGFGGGPSSAQRIGAGAPPGPAWSLENPFGPAPPTPTPTAAGTATPTASTTPTATATASPSASASPSRTPTASATPSLTSTLSATPSTTATLSATPSPTPSPSTAATSTPTAPTPTSLPTATLIPSATPGGTGLPGDISLDGLVNVIDVQLCVNVILGSETDPAVVVRADVTQDGSVNVLDVQAIVNIILAG